MNPYEPPVTSSEWQNGNIVKGKVKVPLSNGEFNLAISMGEYDTIPSCPTIANQTPVYK